MDYHIFHWVWYLLGSIAAPRLTIALALSLHGKSLHLPVIVMIVIWFYAIAELVEVKSKE